MNGEGELCVSVCVSGVCASMYVRMHVCACVCPVRWTGRKNDQEHKWGNKVSLEQRASLALSVRTTCQDLSGGLKLSQR